LITGTVPATQPVSPQIAVAWVNIGGSGGVGALTVVGEFLPVAATSFPAHFDFDIYNPPPAEAVGDLSLQPMPGDGTGAVGLIALVDDVDRDGTFKVEVGKGIVPPDRLLAVSMDFQIEYIETIPANSNPIWKPGLKTGYNLIRLSSNGNSVVDPTTPVDVTFLN
jgi:hypothetical protein